MQHVLIFDTSGLNGLLDDKDSAAMVAAIRIGACVRLTETNLAEIGANSNAEKRARLVGLCQRLLSNGECLKPYHSLIEELVEAHANGGVFNWKAIGVRALELETEVARPKYLNSDVVAEDIREDFRGDEQDFKEMWLGARENFPLPPADRILTTQADVIEASEASDAHWNLGADIYEYYSDKRPSLKKLRAFTKECPPFNMMMLSACLAQFHHAIRDHRLASRYKKVGRLDLLSAVYLPYCELFVTGDTGQYNILQDLAGCGKRLP